MTSRALGRGKLLLVLSPVTHAVTVCVLIQVHRTPQLSSKLLGQLELSAASQANAKTNLIIISSNPAHYRLPNYPINSTSWESLFATQANVCSQISRQEDSSIVQTQGFDNAEQARLVTQKGGVLHITLSGSEVQELCAAQSQLHWCDAESALSQAYRKHEIKTWLVYFLNACF